jgi:hypothetical protein
MLITTGESQVNVRPVGLCMVEGTPATSTIHSYLRKPRVDALSTQKTGNDVHAPCPAHHTRPLALLTWRHMCTVTSSPGVAAAGHRKGKKSGNQLNIPVEKFLSSMLMWTSLYRTASKNPASP